MKAVVIKNEIPKELRKSGGIYILKSLISNDTYIGQTGSFQKRYGIHSGSMRSGKINSPLLRNFIQKHGFNKLAMVVHSVVEDRKERVALEATLLKSLKPSLNMLHAIPRKPQKKRARKPTRKCQLNRRADYFSWIYNTALKAA